MANTINAGSNSVLLTNMDTDWTWTDSYPNHPAGIKVLSMGLTMMHETDYLVIKDAIATGTTIAYFANVAGTTNFHQSMNFSELRVRPFLDISGCSVDLNSQLIIRFK